MLMNLVKKCHHLAPCDYHLTKTIEMIFLKSLREKSRFATTVRHQAHREGFHH
jgi:hypothetical protein